MALGRPADFICFNLVAFANQLMLRLRSLVHIYIYFLCALCWLASSLCRDRYTARQTDRFYTSWAFKCETQLTDLRPGNTQPSLNIHESSCFGVAARFTPAPQAAEATFGLNLERSALPLNQVYRWIYILSQDRILEPEIDSQRCGSCKTPPLLRPSSPA